ncbi:MAG: carboxypeptidase-like regulatory domain-containing protein [Chitinispirillales bacterium]|jgi:hypothetical protein|nr:carboxypeptidase-like regulatory domain-containing protein [Chitinispirillales bacterium]
MKKAVKFFTLVLTSVFSVFAVNDFPVVRYPTWVLNPTDTVRLEWVNLAENVTDSIKIYFSRIPGGGLLRNYTDSINVFENYGRNGIYFIPSKNTNLKPGINYFTIGDKVGNVSSNEVKIILKHNSQNTDLKPIGGFVSAVPQFSWTKPADVPYSHIMLSDEEIKLGKEMSLESTKGVSMIWQAITADNRITYGEPDPSGIFTSAPPPLSPGKKYSWLVFNNYGNNPAYTPANDMVLPAFFSISGIQGEIPENVEPVNNAVLNYVNDSVITFKWKKLEPKASIYRVFVYALANVIGINAQVLVWSGEVTAGQFAGKDTASLIMNAKDILSKNRYSWRVIAVNDDGSAQAGSLSDFSYSAPSGTIRVRAVEEISFGSQNYRQNLGLAEVKLEALQGSQEETMLFFTDNNGFAEKTRAVGTYKIMLKKEGYESESKIITVAENSIVDVDFLLHKPFSSIYGKVTDKNGVPVNLAIISAVSYDGDTIKTHSLSDGNFVFSCVPKEWVLSVYKQGYSNLVDRRVVLKNGQSLQQNFSIEKNSLVLSGTIKNSDGDAVIGAAVKIYTDGGMEVASLLSTSDDGRFSFPLASGNYVISASKTGLVSYSNSIEFSASQDRNIILSSGAALLKGTLYGESWITSGNTLEKISAAVTNAKIEVIDTSGERVVSTSATDKVYGTYSVSVPENPDAKYRLVFSADGFNACSTFTNSTIKKNNTYLQDVKINAFASISGKVFDKSAKAVEDISVSLVKDGISVVSTISDVSGNFSFFRIPDGKYLISANGSGQAKDIIEQVANETGIAIINNTVTIENGIFYSGSKIAKSASINITMKSVNSKIVLVARTEESANVKDNSVAITVYSPFTKRLENDTLSGIAADPSVKYFVRTVSNDPLILDCQEKIISFNVGAVDGEILKDTILMPFRYLQNQSVEIDSATFKLSMWKTGIAINHDSVFVYYRHSGETNFKRNKGTVNVASGEISFVVKPQKTGSNIEFYFEISANSAVYGNKTHLYTKFVGASPTVITRLELLPVAANDNGINIALNSRAEVYVKAYYGANFKPIDSLDASKFSWKLSDDNVIGISKSEKDASVVITGKSVGICTLTVSLNSGYGLDTANGVIRSISVIVNITSSEISSLKVIRLSQSEHSNYITNDERIIFGVEAKDKNGNLVFVMPQWIITPKNAGKIDSRTGIFTPDTNFIGRVFVTAYINSKIRDEFIWHDRKGILVAYSVNNNAFRVYEGNADLNFAENSSVDGSHIIVSLDKLDVNFTERDIEESKVFLISDIFELKKEFGERFSLNATKSADSDPVTLTLNVPQIYHSNFNNGVTDSSKLGIAIWDADNLHWEYIGRNAQKRDALDTARKSLTPKGALYDSKNKSLSIPVGEYINQYDKIRAGVIAKGLTSDAMVSVSPNPFSPFVSPINDYVISEMNADVKGTCIKITPKSNSTKFRSSANIGIYTAEGTIVYRATLNGLDAGQSYYLFWDGRKQLSQTETNKLIPEPNTALFVKGGELCRNGRYFVNITIDDGKEKKRYTKEIILFK